MPKEGPMKTPEFFFINTCEHKFKAGRVPYKQCVLKARDQFKGTAHTWEGIHQNKKQAAGKCRRRDIESPFSPCVRDRLERFQALSDPRPGAYAPQIGVQLNNHHTNYILDTTTTGNFIQSQLLSPEQKTQKKECSRIIQMAQHESRLAIEGIVTLPVSMKDQFRTLLQIPNTTGIPALLQKDDPEETRRIPLDYRMVDNNVEIEGKRNKAAQPLVPLPS
ncbi:hypothetical protein PR048_012448 [Dryococelus australis]|uniref:Uncharacterized protein n=1 Tax=Dryococelus australis TaxID=614101 RepID=A0ABQ9HQ35_9NEOP|nr:hypothetical protein PR048_012448 [Dryococelus australis]